MTRDTRSPARIAAECAAALAAAALLALPQACRTHHPTAGAPQAPAQEHTP